MFSIYKEFEISINCDLIIKIFALADTYCPLFERENGRELLTRVLNDPNVNEAIKKYANIVMKNVNTFKNG